jgi:hypothetical protein
MGIIKNFSNGFRRAWNAANYSGNPYYRNTSPATKFFGYLLIILAFLGLIVLSLGFIFGCMCLGALILMVCWNYVAGYFHGPHITFWVAFCIVILLGFLRGNTSVTRSK